MAVSVAAVIIAVAMRVIVVVMVRVPRPALQQPGRRHVHQQSGHRDDQRGADVDRLGAPQAQGRLEHDADRDDAQHQRAREAAEHLDLPGAEGEARVARMPSRQRVRDHRHAQRQRVRAHVPAVGQQRHRAGPPAGADLHHHGHQREREHPPRAGLPHAIAAVEVVAVLPRRQIVGVAVRGGRQAHPRILGAVPGHRPIPLPAAPKIVDFPQSPPPHPP
jgi:hypothetical protein